MKQDPALEFAWEICFPFTREKEKERSFVKVKDHKILRERKGGPCT